MQFVEAAYRALRRIIGSIMVFLGTLSLMQIFFLPGLAVFSMAPMKMGVIEKGILIVLTSILANFLLIWLLVVLGIYQQDILLAIIGIEAVVILYSATKNIRNTSKALVVGSITDPTVMRFSVLDIAIVFVLLFMCFALFVWWAPYLGGPFLRADPNVIWNAWAKVWASGSMPSNTSGYPQLLPELWSLVYVISGGTEIQSFARSLNAFFPWLGIIGLALLLRGNSKSAFILACCSIVPLWFLSAPFRPYVFHGFAELPLASLILLFSIALIVRGARGDLHRDLIHIAGLAAILATATKLNGVFLCAALPIIVYLQDRKIAHNRELRLSIIYSILGIVFCAAWFLYFLIKLDAGQEDYRQFTAIPSSLSDLWAYIQGAKKPAIAAWDTFGPILMSAALVIFLLSLFDKQLWPISVFVILPFVAFWLIFLSYGVRNAIHTSGLFSLMLGLLVERYLPQKMKKAIGRELSTVQVPTQLFRRALPFAPLVAFFSISTALLMLYLSPPVSDNNLLKFEESRKWTMRRTAPEVNRALMASFPISEKPIKVFTDHWPIFVLESKANLDFNWNPDFRDPPTMLAQWIMSNPDGYVLLSREIGEETRQFTEEMVYSGDYEIIFRQGGLVLLAPID